MTAARVRRGSGGGAAGVGRGRVVALTGRHAGDEVAPVGLQTLDGHPALADQMVDEGRAELGHQGVGEEFAVGVRDGLAQQQGDVAVQDASGGDGEAAVRGGFGGQLEVQFVDRAAQQGVAEGAQSLRRGVRRGRAGAGR
ncbi:hypothetical protein GCM10020256_05080 [Streptomyces thermocoprophilus]